MQLQGGGLRQRGALVIDDNAADARAGAREPDLIRTRGPRRVILRAGADTRRRRTYALAHRTGRAGRSGALPTPRRASAASLFGSHHSDRCDRRAC
ncbi:hypothetical protein DBP21_16865 [Streptomyces sp. CS147]|nr:hypothetical protein DBP21_16865 [Streptomyces sp. CS147]